MKVYLSPSDQWSNPASGSGHSEAHHCLLICKSAYKYLILNNIECMIGDNSKEGSYVNRTNESNKYGADLHIPVHTNAGGGKGTLCLVYDNNSKSNKYVQSIYNEVASLTPTADKGIVVNSSLYEINGTTAMCCYLEVEFHDNVETEKWIDSNIDNIGKAIAKGVVKANGGVFKDESEKHDTPLSYLYKVQVGAFKDKKNAEKLANELKNKGYSVFIREE